MKPKRQYIEELCEKLSKVGGRLVLGRGIFALETGCGVGVEKQRSVLGRKTGFD